MTLDRVQMLRGDCLAVLPTLADNSIDAIVTDPPAGIAFMGKEWDHDHGGRDGWVKAFAAIFAECLRVAKPGAHALVWALPRTSHWTATALEDAGWEIRDCVYHLQGQGFPKSSRVNRDPAFCQCGATGHSAVSTSREQPMDGHSDTGEPMDDGALPLADAHHSSRKPEDSPSDYPRGNDSDDEHAQKVIAGDLGRLRLPVCVPEHSHSGERGSVEADRPAHSPSLALCTDHPSNQDCLGLSAVESTDGTCTQASRPRPCRTDSDAESQAGRRPNRGVFPSASDTSTSDYRLGLPRCPVCGKPNADGWGTALKPAVECWWLCRKPLTGTVAANVREWGTGAINVDGCRIDSNGTHGSADSAGQGKGHKETTGNGIYHGAGGVVMPPHPLGRWPAHLTLSHLPECRDVGVRKVRGVQRAAGTPAFGSDRDDGYELGTGREYGPDQTASLWKCAPGCAVAMLDEQSGNCRSAGLYAKGYIPDPLKGAANIPLDGQGSPQYADTGGASRFFYVAKASRSERERGLEGMDKHGGTFGHKRCARCGRQAVNVSGTCECDEPEWIDGDEVLKARNHHPTVKPLALMRWLCRLITPPGGLVLDPFAGSGTTGCAAIAEGFRFLGIERDEGYHAIAVRRIEAQPVPLEIAV